jgi:hypothetical protein
MPLTPEQEEQVRRLQEQIEDAKKKIDPSTWDAIKALFTDKEFRDEVRKDLSKQNFGEAFWDGMAKSIGEKEPKQAKTVFLATALGQYITYRCWRRAGKGKMEAWLMSGLSSSIFMLNRRVENTMKIIREDDLREQVTTIRDDLQRIIDEDAAINGAGVLTQVMATKVVANLDRALNDDLDD